MRSLLWPAGIAGTAVAAAGARWLMQGSGNLYTATAKRFYQPDPEVGWRVAEAQPVWLGLEVIAVLAAVVVGLLVAAWVIRWRERKTARTWTWARRAAWAVAPLPLALPILAFASGGKPDGAKEHLPIGQTAAAPTEGVSGKLDAPAGTYQAIAHDGTSITARLTAGGETFDARFASGVEGSWTGDPSNLAAPMTGTFTVAAKGVDTGIAMRSEHARDEYLHAAKHPTVGFTLTRTVAVRQDGDALVFRGAGSIALMGKDLPVEVTGTMRAPDAAGRTRLGLAERKVLVVQADFSFKISESPLAVDRSSFDADLVPIHVSLVLAQ